MAGEWRETTLGGVIELKRGYDLPSRDRRVGPFPIISSSGVTGYHAEAKAKAPGVVIGRYGTLGEVHYITTDYWPLNTSLYVHDFKGNHPRFISYFLRSLDFGAYSDKAAVPGLNRNDLHTSAVRLPPVSEQRVIAHILGTLDDKIELNRRMNETLEAIARALFKSWFVDFDPVRAKAEGRDPGLPKPLATLFPDSVEDSELGEIPKGWEVRSLYETATFVNGAAFRSADCCDPSEGLPVVKIAELKDGIGDQTKFSQRDLDPDQRIDTGDLLYSWSGSPDTSLDAFVWTKGRGLLNQHIFKVVTPAVADRRLVYCLLKYLRPLLIEIARNKQTTGLGHVTVADMKRLHVCWPPTVVLAGFDGRVGPILDKAFGNILESHVLATFRCVAAQAHLR